jgi:hypothetical protein
VTGFTRAAPSKNLVRERKQAMAHQLFGVKKGETGEFDTLHEQAREDWQARDLLIGQLLLLTDLHYQDYRESLYAMTSGTDFAGSAIITAMNAASTLSGGEQFKTLIAATTTGLSGVKTEFNRSILRDKTLHAIFKQMDASRAVVNLRIQRSLSLSRSAAGLKDYSIDEALRDVVAYYNAGTLVGALDAIENNAVKQQEKAEVIINTKVRNIPEL